MRSDELRTLLHERGEEVHDLGAAARLDAVDRRVRTTRRRRAAVAGGGLVVAVAAVALAVVPGAGESGADVSVAGPGPAPTGAYTMNGVTFQEEVLGEHLLAAAVGNPGETEVTLEMKVPQTGLRFSELCFGPGYADRTMTVTVDGTEITGAPCTEEAPSNPGADGTTFTDPVTGMGEQLGLHPGDTIEVRAVVMKRYARPGGGDAAADGSQVVAGIGVYEDLGSADGPWVELPDEIVRDGRTWELDTVTEGVPGQDVLGSRAGRGYEPVLVVLGHRGLRGPVEYRASWDGSDPVSRVLRGPESGGWQAVGTMQAGPRRDVFLEVTHGSVEGAKLALGEYVPAG